MLLFHNTDPDAVVVISDVCLPNFRPHIYNIFDSCLMHSCNKGIHTKAEKIKTAWQDLLKK